MIPITPRRSSRHMNTKNHHTADLPLSISRIFAVTDLSKQAARLWNGLGLLPTHLGAKLVLLHVIDIFSLAETDLIQSHFTL